jgi:glycosyltransferase involved in cell wall biosynthesis
LTDPLVIVHIVAPGVVGGTESVVRGLATGHHRQGHQVHVIVVLDSPPQEHPLVRSLQESGVTVHALQLGARAYLRERRMVQHLLQQVRPSIVHTHGYRPDILDAPVARALGIATVTTLHGSSRIGGRSAMNEWLQMRLLGRSQAIVGVSRRIVEEVRQLGIPDARVHYIPNGWVPTAEALGREEARAALGMPQQGVVIGWVGRLIPVKACDNFLRALSAARGLPLRAAIVGDGPEHGMLQSLSRELGLADQVHFCGPREQAGRLFTGFDGFVISSRSEGTPITLLEAMAAGVPVATTTVGGIPDVVTAREALLVPPGDPAALGNAIRQLVDDPGATRTRVAAATRRLHEEFGAERWLASHEAVYRSARIG